MNVHTMKYKEVSKFPSNFNAFNLAKSRQLYTSFMYVANQACIVS